MDSKSIRACRSTQRRSRRQNGPSPAASEPQREKTNPVIAGSVCTHLLPWGCHTIMELVLAALPVETTGALLRTGAMAEIAAILFVRAVMPELAPHYGARVGSWKQLSGKT